MLCRVSLHLGDIFCTVVASTIEAWDSGRVSLEERVHMNVMSLVTNPENWRENMPPSLKFKGNSVTSSTWYSVYEDHYFPKLHGSNGKIIISNLHTLQERWKTLEGGVIILVVHIDGHLVVSRHRSWGNTNINGSLSIELSARIRWVSRYGPRTSPKQVKLCIHKIYPIIIPN